MSIKLSRNHSFHYKSQWDPGKVGTTKGGYLQGEILLPEGWRLGDRSLSLVLTCAPYQENEKNPHQVQPCFLHVVFMESDGNRERRNKEKEPAPSFDNWRVKLDIENRGVFGIDKDGLRFKVAELESVAGDRSR